MSPVSPALAENLAAEVVGHYQEAERQLLERIARNLAKGIDGPHWAEQKYAQLLAYQRQTEALIADLRAKSKNGVDTAITSAYERGGLSAVADMNVLGVTPVEHLAGLRAVEAMAAETLGYVNATHPRILRSTMDAYRAAIEAGSKQAFVGSMERVAASEAARTIVAENAQQVLLGATTRRQATQAALDAFAKKGITGFIDKSGRGWNLESYVEMAMCSGTGKAAVAGHEDRLVENGLDLVIISDAPRECPLCRPHEGKVYSISGTSTKYPSLASARAQGLFHVRCRHSESAYQEGITRPMTNTEDPEGYAATQKLRYLERNVRQSKRMEAAAGIDPAALAKATRRKLDYQQKIRTLVDTTTAKRQPYRESLGVTKAQLAKLKPKP